MSIENNKAVAHQMLDEVFNQGNMSLADELLSPNYIEHEELPPGVPAGREGLKQTILMTRAAFPDFSATIEDIVAEGDKVAQRITWTGTHKGDFMGIPATGKSVSIQVLDIIRVVDGHLVEHWGLMDSMGLMQQLDVMPAPGEG
jgi:steroid delta-isomerase-like uncharacterized protein